MFSRYSRFGFFMLPTSILSTDIFLNNHSLFRTYAFLYCIANYQQFQIISENTDLELNFGELILDKNLFESLIWKNFDDSHIEFLLKEKYLEVRKVDNLEIFKITNFVTKFDSKEPVPFVKVPRNIFLNKNVVSSDYRFIIWIYILHLANHDSSIYVYRQQRFLLKRGMVSTGSKKMGKCLHIDPSTIRKAIDSFEKLGLIKKTVRNGNFTCFEIIDYLNLESKPDPVVNHNNSSRQPSNNYGNRVSQSIPNSFPTQSHRSHTDLKERMVNKNQYSIESSERKDTQSEISKTDSRRHGKISRPQKGNIIN